MNSRLQIKTEPQITTNNRRSEFIRLLPLLIVLVSVEEILISGGNLFSYGIHPPESSKKGDCIGTR